MSKKMTAVEWLADVLHGFIHPEHGKDFLPILEQAKSMEKEQKLKHELFIGKVVCEIGMEKTLELLKEVNQIYGK